ncbi:hypothetical protein HDV02_004106 [Globomyces sp. JEL0801]|nr:hypothetical protein HDV02_004106 [Globomyces sp. JEL0801]
MSMTSELQTLTIQLDRLGIDVHNLKLISPAPISIESRLSDVSTLIDFQETLAMKKSDLDFYSFSDSDENSDMDIQDYLLQTEPYVEPFVSDVFASAMSLYNSDQDLERAFQLFEQCASKEHIESKSMCGYMLEHGYGVKLNIKQAIIYYQDAVDYQSPSAFNHLGFLYRYGKGVIQIGLKAFQLFEKSAKLDYAPGQNHLAQCFQNGIGCNVDIDMAIYWYDKAAEQQYPPALNNLGYCYEIGLGVDQDNCQAQKLYYIAWKSGNGIAAYNLASMYETMENPRLDLAAAWYRRAARLGDIPSLVRLRLL